VALRAVILVAVLWAAGIFLITLVGLLIDLRQHGWLGLVEPAGLSYALLFATASYLLRFARWHMLATRLAPDLALGESFTAHTIGFGLMMTPARAGEVLKLALLRQRTAVPIATSTPIFFMEKLCEAVALAGLAVASSLYLPWAEAVAPTAKLWLVGVALASLAIAITLRDRLISLAPRLPLVGRLLGHRRSGALWSHLVSGTTQVFTWPMLLIGLALSFAARLCDGVAIVWVASLYGVDLSFAAGWFSIGSSGFLGGISMLPGGVGVAEASLIGLFLALGAGPAAAVAAAFTSRILIFWIWVAIGLALALRYVVHPWKLPPEEDR
jgi:uncharacterized membrane protein YbhN (UPF0104 family)